MAFSSWGYNFHDQRFLHPMARLEILNATGTDIGVYISNDTFNEIFKMSAKLKVLLLRSAKLSSIPPDEFANLHNLETLDISNNGLKQVSFRVSSLFSLSCLNLTENKLYQLTDELTSELEKLFVNTSHTLIVDLQHNFLICDCASLSFIKWISKTGINLINKDKFLYTYQGHQEITLVAVDIDKLTRDCYLIYIVTSTVGGIALLIIATIILVYKYRWKIKTLLLKIVNYNRNRDNNVYQYDAFVVYSDEDRQWVHNVLLYELETVRGMKVCVHFRDFIPGEVIDKNIVDAIDNSRKTLLILTKHFLVSEWCEYEMQSARNQLQAEGKDVVVPILLAELPDGYFNPSVKNLIREKTYLQWETSIAGQEYIWEKLAIALRSNSTKQNIDQNKQKQNATLPIRYSELIEVPNDGDTDEYGYAKYGSINDICG